MSIWCVKPENVTLELKYVAGDGSGHPFTITVKKRLTVGEERRVMTAGWGGWNSGQKHPDGRPADPELQINWKVQTFARTEAYLLDWSLKDDDGIKLLVDMAVIESLHPDVYKIIEDAITAHVEAMGQEKKATRGSSAPSRIIAS